MGYIGRGPVKSGAFRIIDDVSSGFDGSDVTFTLQHNSSNITPGTEQNLLIAVDGVMQEPIDAFTISGSVLTFTSAPASGASFWGVELGDVGGIAQTIANGTVDTAQLVADAVTNAELANMATRTVKANATSGSANPTDVVMADGDFLIANASGLVTVPIAGDVAVSNTGAAVIQVDAVDIAMLSASGTASSSTFLRGDNQWEAAGGAFTRVGGTTSEQTHNATSSTQILASGTVSVPAATPLFLTVNSRKTAGAASQCRLQWQLETTTDHERAVHSASNQAEAFIGRAWVGARAANYQTIIMTTENSSGPNNTVYLNSGSLAMPIATLTAVDLWANALNSSQTQGCNYLHVYTHAVA